MVDQLWSIESFSSRFPQIFHMAEADSWPKIKELGLLSTSAILDLFEIDQRTRQTIESNRRPQIVTLENKKYGRIAIRDQKPLSEQKLAKSLLDGLSVSDWLRLLNSKVFFWVEQERLLRLRTARAYYENRQLLILCDTKKLLNLYSEITELSDRNTGATRMPGHMRGLQTFLPLLQTPMKRRVVELVVPNKIPDFEKFVITATEVGGGKPDRVLYKQKSKSQ